MTKTSASGKVRCSVFLRVLLLPQSENTTLDQDSQEVLRLP